MSKLTRKRDHFWPAGDSWCIMFSSTVLNSQFMVVEKRFPSSVVLGRIKRIGINIDSRLVGMNIISGLANCSNIFMFMVGLRLVLLLALLRSELLCGFR